MWTARHWTEPRHVISVVAGSTQKVHPTPSDPINPKTPALTIVEVHSHKTHLPTLETQLQHAYNVPLKVRNYHSTWQLSLPGVLKAKLSDCQF